MKKCISVTFEEKENYEETLVEFLEEYFDVVACNYTESSKEQYVAYMGGEFDEKDMIATAVEQSVVLPTYRVDILTSENWLKDNVIEFAPVEVEEFLIYGVHEKEEPETDKMAIKIYAATAFGSEHQTTKSCLKAISDVHKRIGDEKVKVLDVGCGSGILSLACAKIWNDKAKVVAVDIDEEAVYVTKQNASDNGLSEYIVADLSDGYSNQLVQENAPYDLIIANILARPLIEMAEDLAKNLQKGGYCILSGFIENQQEWVVEEHMKQGLKLVEVYNLDNWRAALMEK